MPYMYFPSKLTEEEHMLQAKYQQLKEMRMALHALKAHKQEPEKTTDVRDAREVARDLIKSGAIAAIPKPNTKQDQTSFKRPKEQERKFTAPEVFIATYQPFSSTENCVAQEAITNEIIKEDPRVQNLSQECTTERDREEPELHGTPTMLDPRQPDKPRTGNTIFVLGNKVTEAFLKKIFNDCGTIVNVCMEIEKGRGFVTFAKPDSADRAIEEMHGKNIDGIKLRVKLARRQPQMEPINDASSSAAWSAIAATKSKKGSHMEGREMVEYNEDWLNG